MGRGPEGTWRVSGITNWSMALTDPRLWACYYSLTDDVYGPVWGLSERDVRTYSYTVMGCADHPELLDSDEAAELVDGSVVRLPFPDGFTWVISMGPEGDLHVLHHPTAFPNGQLIAEVSGHEQWPGLRWPEALHIAHYLRGHWTADFPVDAVLPLLTPVIGLSPDDSSDEVHDALADAWRGLGVVAADRLEVWLQRVEHWPLRRTFPVTWTYHPDTGWTNPVPTSPRHRSSLPFVAFFTMVDRCSAGASPSAEAEA